ncbi:putative ester cyclase [Neobacillus niacini]|nr:putative ester cyclase [Neobacillus niacini]
MGLQKRTFRSIVNITIVLGAIIMVAACTKTNTDYEPAKTAHAEIQLLKDLPQPKSMTIDSSLKSKEATAMVQTAQRFYGFWNTGNEDLISQAVASSFFDNTLPKGRPQGPKGLLFASSNFRKAVPDLQCTIEDLLVSADKVTARLSFTGTYKGKFMGKTPTGKPVHFFAIDILHFSNGKIVEDWHLEDNLTLMQQLGVVSEN